jgi:hypothetical protein
MPLRILFLLLLFSQVCNAQPPQLPAMNIITEKAQNILTWTNQYDGIKSIAVQRSIDSIRNFVTIGIINTPKKGPMTFTDERPMPGRNHYRLMVDFTGDMEWFSNVYKVTLDSSIIARSVMGAIETGTTNSKTATGSTNGIAPANPTDFYYSPSLRIYTNPYTGHININLDDALSKKYNIRFYDPEKAEVLRISRVTKTVLILDKNNFNSRGTYSFKLFDGAALVETGYITIY